ncbi:hypothetical protein ACJX0J_005520 [Zea mays]
MNSASKEALIAIFLGLFNSGSLVREGFHKTQKVGDSDSWMITQCYYLLPTGRTLYSIYTTILVQSSMYRTRSIYGQHKKIKICYSNDILSTVCLDRNHQDRAYTTTWKKERKELMQLLSGCFLSWAGKHHFLRFHPVDVASFVHECNVNKDEVLI